MTPKEEEEEEECVSVVSFEVPFCSSKFVKKEETPIGKKKKKCKRGSKKMEKSR